MDKHSSHDSFEHDSIDGLGYDWERIADPAIPPKHPLKVYLPRSPDDVVAALKEVKKLKQTLRIRSKGHSSNDLVTVQDGCVLCTDKLNQLDDNCVDRAALIFHVPGRRKYNNLTGWWSACLT